jgi:hypothetical protein
MKSSCLFSLAALAAAMVPFTATAGGSKKDTRLFELRIYTANKGKLDALNARFRDHTLKLFEKHGMTNIGYWVPLDNPDEKLYYLLAHKDRATRDASFKAFGADPAWQTAAKESEKNGKLVKGIQAIFLTATDYSPPIKAETGTGARVFELRIYKASPGNLEALNARFRNHTLKLFEKHGMKNLWYTTLVKGEKGTDTMLYYMLSHPSKDAGLKAFDTFRKDPAWIEAKNASEDKAGGSLTVKDGVQSTYMKATDYSPTK